MVLILSHLFLVDRNKVVRVLLNAVCVDATGIPHEFLEELIVILLLYHLACRFYNVADILNELLAIGRELVDVDKGVITDVGEGVVDLFVIWVASLAKCLDDAVETELE